MKSVPAAPPPPLFALPRHLAVALSHRIIIHMPSLRRRLPQRLSMKHICQRCCLSLCTPPVFIPWKKPSRCRRVARINLKGVFPATHDELQWLQICILDAAHHRCGFSNDHHFHRACTSRRIASAASADGQAAAFCAARSIAQQHVQAPRRCACAAESR